jgi:hypothetical protein
MYSPSIRVFGSRLKNIQAFGDDIYIGDEDTLWCIQQDSEKEILNLFDYNTFTLISEGMWLIKRISKEGVRSEFLDYFEKGFEYPPQPYDVEKNCIFIADRYIGVSMDDKCGLFVKKTIGDNIQFKEGSYYPGIAVSDNNIIVREFSQSIVCFDKNLAEIWRFPNFKQITTDAERKPQLYHDIVIINLGEDSDKKNSEFEMVALNITNGSVKWQLNLPITPYNSDLIGDKIYITLKDRMMFLDAENGEVKLDVPEQFGRLYPTDEGLLGIGRHDSWVHLLSHDGKNCLQKITSPSSYVIDTRDFPLECNNKIYLYLVPIDMGISAISGALLELQKDDKAEKELSIDYPAPVSFEINVLKNKQGEHEHLISIDHDNIKEVIRFGAIKLKEIAYTVSS